MEYIKRKSLGNNHLVNVKVSTSHCTIFCSRCYAVIHGVNLYVAFFIIKHYLRAP